MKKVISIVLSVLLCLSLAGCGTKSFDTAGLDTISNNREELIKKAVSKFYITQVPQNNGALKVYNTKSFKDKFFVLAEKYSGEGHRFTNLFLLDEKYNIIAWTGGLTPISMCFSINKVDYDGNTILFGTFNNSKWDSKQDKKISVQISNLDVKFSNSQNIKEDVSVKSGYIVISDSISKVEKFNLYNDKNELQSNLEELGNVFEAVFEEFKSK